MPDLLKPDYNHVIWSSMDSSGFNADTVRRLTGITYRQLDYWDRTGLVRPSIRGAQGKGSRRVYSFQDVVEVRVVSRMLASGVSLLAVRKALRYLTQHFDHVVRPLAQLMLVADGKRVLVRMEDRPHLIDPTAVGQVVITVAVAAIAAELKSTVIELAAPRGATFKLRGRTYRAVLTPDLEAGGFTVEVPELPGVITEADTVAEARLLARDAAAIWLDAADSVPAANRPAR
jgi:DNA-binding transcriptional MerR regulator/predicted RNase H-like HicB family nuclease